MSSMIADRGDVRDKRLGANQTSALEELGKSRLCHRTTVLRIYPTGSRADRARSAENGVLTSRQQSRQPSIIVGEFVIRREQSDQGSWRTSLLDPTYCD
jgi:hypothetical protein